jgi:hypothetical protein
MEYLMYVGIGLLLLALGMKLGMKFCQLRDLKRQKEIKDREEKVRAYEFQLKTERAIETVDKAHEYLKKKFDDYEPSWIGWITRGALDSSGAKISYRLDKPRPKIKKKSK